MPQFVIRFNFKNLLKFIICNCALFYFIIFLIGYNLTDIKKLKSGFAVRNYYMRANILYLIQSVEGKTDFDPEELKKITQYYETSAQYLDQEADVFGVLGVCYFYLNDRAKSIETLNKAIEINPNFFWYHYDLAAIYYNQKNYSQALISFENAVKIQPAQTLQAIGDSKKIYWPLFGGLANINKLRTRLVEGYWQSYKIMTYICLDQKKYSEAIGYATYAINAKLDQNGEFYFLAGMAYYKLNQFDNAIIVLNKANQKNPQFADGFYYLGLCLKNIGQKQAGENMITQSNQMKENVPQTAIIDSIVFPQVF